MVVFSLALSAADAPMIMKRKRNNLAEKTRPHNNNNEFVLGHWLH